MRRQASEDRSSRTKLLDEDLLAEKIDRSAIHANAEGSIEPHSGVPELWNIDGTEVDLEQHYTLGEPTAMRLFDSPCRSSHPRCVVLNRPITGTIHLQTLVREYVQHPCARTNADMFFVVQADSSGTCRAGSSKPSRRGDRSSDPR